MGEDERGKFIWRTIGGRKIKIYEGQDLKDAMKESGKFNVNRPNNTDTGSGKPKTRLDRLKELKKEVEEVKKSLGGEDGENGIGANSSAKVSGKKRELILKYKRIKERVEEEKKRRERYNYQYLHERLKSTHDRLLEELKKDTYSDDIYDISTFEKLDYSTGYQVSFSQIGDNYDSNQYYEIYSEFSKFSSDGKVGVLKYNGEPVISFNIQNREDAIALAEKYNQVNIWDWDKADVIKIGGNGRRLRIL